MNNPHSVSKPLSRREFLARASLGAAAVGLTTTIASAATPQASTTPQTKTAANTSFEIAAFEKHFFEKYSPEEIAQTCDEMDLHLELTVRPNGHIKPENTADELPKMVAALARRKRRILVIACSVIRPDEPHTEQVLRTAQQLGIRQYRHRGFTYEAGKPLKSQIASFRSMAREFAAMNKEIGIQALYQNHAGASAAGAAIWDLDQILDDIDPSLFGVAFDTRHLIVEQGFAWPTAVELIAPRIAALYVKSFKWERNRPVETPLRDGIVNRKVIDQVVAVRGNLPICLHVEHLKLAPVAFSERASTVEAFRDDTRILRGWLGMA